MSVAVAAALAPVPFAPLLMPPFAPPLAPPFAPRLARLLLLRPRLGLGLGLGPQATGNVGDLLDEAREPREGALGEQPQP